MLYRIANISDCQRIAQIHCKTERKNANGIFVKLGYRFLKSYYKVLLSDPYTLFICAEDKNRIIQGFCFNVLDSEMSATRTLRYKVRLGFAALFAIVANPSLIKELLLRFKSLKKKDDTFIQQSGVRGGFWGWDPDSLDSISSIELHERNLMVIAKLGYEKINIEVDENNKAIFKFHKINGAVITNQVQLNDGRIRYLMVYDLVNRKPLTKI